MAQRLSGPRLAEPDLRRLLAYVADLELEVDRLRRHGHRLHKEARSAVDQIRRLCADPSAAAGGGPALARIDGAAEQLGGVLRDLSEVPGYHPAHDQVVAIAVRPLAEQVFRWQQRLLGAGDVALRLELGCEHVEWFPSRFRHILNSLFSNALKYRDPEKTESWLRLGLRELPEGYELRVEDNGIGLGRAELDQVFDLFYRAAPAQAAGLGVGLAVVKMLVEHSGGSLSVDAGAGQGATFVAVLPRYAVDDFLT
jgi:signal transduction histidine kinase